MTDYEFVLRLQRIVEAGGFISFLTLHTKESPIQVVLHAGLNLFTGYGIGPKEALQNLQEVAIRQGTLNHPKIAAALGPGQPLHGVWGPQDKK